MHTTGVSGGSAGEHVVESSTLGIGAFAQILIDAGARHGYTVVAVGPNRYRLAKTYRPTWALVVAVITALFACVGLLFLLVKRTETGDATFAEARGGVALRLVGSLSPAFLADLRASVEASGGIRASSPAGTPPPPSVATPPSMAFEPPAPVTPPPISAGSVPTDALLSSAIPLDTVVHRPEGAVLVVDDKMSIQVGAGGVVGRDPAPDSRVPDGRLYPVAEPSLSKTHFAFGPSPSGIWVVDHHSTNGTFLLENGQHVVCMPGVVTEVPFGASVLAGDLELKVRRR